MRIVQVLIPEGKREPVLAVLDDEQIDYAVWDETGRGDFEALVQFPIPPIGVEPVMARLREAGISENSYTIVISPETVVSQRIEALKKRYSGLRISREELIARAEDLAPATSTFYAFLVLSTIIATGGLLLDSAATIIGAMVVAPLMGPAISASVGTVINERELASRGVKLQVGGLLLAIAVAAVIGAIMKGTLLLPPGLDIREIGQIAERTSPNFLSLFLALGSGLAGAISIMRGVRVYPCGGGNCRGPRSPGRNIGARARLGTLWRGDNSGCTGAREPADHQRICSHPVLAFWLSSC